MTRTIGTLTAADLGHLLSHGKTNGIIRVVEHARDGESGVCLHHDGEETWLYLSHDEPVIITRQDHQW